MKTKYQKQENVELAENDQKGIFGMRYIAKSILNLSEEERTIKDQNHIIEITKRKKCNEIYLEINIYCIDGVKLEELEENKVEEKFNFIVHRYVHLINKLRFKNHAYLADSYKKYYKLNEKEYEFFYENGWNTKINISYIKASISGGGFLIGIIAPPTIKCGSFDEWKFNFDIENSIKSTNSNLEKNIALFLETKFLQLTSFDFDRDALIRFYLIIESYKGKTSNCYEDIKYARNFVSHPKCTRKENTNFIKKEIGINEDDQSVEFDKSNNAHVGFVKKYVEKAECKARELLEGDL